MDSELGRWLTSPIRCMQQRARQQTTVAPRHVAGEVRDGFSASSFASLPHEVLLIIIEQIESASAPNIHMHIPRATPDVSEYRFEPWSVRDDAGGGGRYTLLALSQTCRRMRQAVLPILWRTMSVHITSQLEFYTHLLERTPNARHVYGQHVRHLVYTTPSEQAGQYDADSLDQIWASSAAKHRFQKALDFAERNTERQGRADIVVCSSPQLVKDRMRQFFAIFRDLRSICYSPHYTPFDRSMCGVLETADSNAQLQSFELRCDWCFDYMPYDEQGQHSVPNLTRSIQHLDLHLNMASFFGRDYEAHVHADRDAPFGFRIDEPRPLSGWHSSLPSLTWVLHTCWQGAQHNVRSVVLPLQRVLYSHKVLQRLWLCIEVRPRLWHHARKDDCVECEAWIMALAIVRAAVVESIGGGTDAEWLRRVRPSVTQRYPSFAQWDKSTAPRSTTAIRQTGQFGVTRTIDAVLLQTLLDTLIPWALEDILDNIESDTDMQHVLVQYHGQRRQMHA